MYKRFLFLMIVFYARATSDVLESYNEIGDSIYSAGTRRGYTSLDKVISETVLKSPC